MCSFLFTNKTDFDINTANYLLKKRGPDHTNYIKKDGFFYLHNLLSITGEFTPQPIESNDCILLFNGEIYNYSELGDHPSDGFCIIDMYRSYGLAGFEKLDGEFSIFLHDKKNNNFIICTDTFGTKPMYYAIEDGEIGVSSYPTPLKSLGFGEVFRANPNKIVVIESSTMDITEEKTLYKWDLNQFKNTFDDWEKAFEKSIIKRSSNLRHSILVPMSSGYDSGIICLFLNNLKKDYVSYTIIGQEERNTISQRLNFSKNSIKETIERLGKDKIEELKSDMKKNSQTFFYGPIPTELMYDGFEDQGAIGLYHILKECKEKHNIRIVLSGQGSDEIMSNIQSYGFKTQNPAYFTDDLKSVFPWGNFYYGSQWSYLMKEECLAGSLGIETRYPFLDRQLVQEFLNLSPHLKNANYKAPIDAIFRKYGYPFVRQKIGFQII